MNAEIKYSLSERSDLERIKDLLGRNNLPVSDITGDKISFIVATGNNNDLLGCIGIEQYGKDGLLRSLAVDQKWRNKRIGHELLNNLISLGRENGISDLHLLTTTADKFFSRAGFNVSARNEAPAAISSTAEFSSLCPSSSVYMIKNIE